MELKDELKGRILEAVQQDRKGYSSDSKHATALGISASVYTNLKKGNLDKQLSEAGWLGIAHRLGVPLRADMAWVAVETETFAYITGQLEKCQRYGLSAVLCDIPNIGKTFTARHYARTHSEVAYVDCSQVKTKMRLVRSIAAEFGVKTDGRYADTYQKLVDYLTGAQHPLIILDEAGDLQYEAFLELKALWNVTEGSCGWYMMGADGLRAKINRSIEHERVGYAEILSRYGGKYSRVTPELQKEQEAFLLKEAMLVARANAPEGADAVRLARRAGGLRRVRTEIMKLRSEN